MCRASHQHSVARQFVDVTQNRRVGKPRFDLLHLAAQFLERHLPARLARLAVRADDCRERQVGGGLFGVLVERPLHGVGMRGLSSGLFCVGEGGPFESILSLVWVRPPQRAKTAPQGGEAAGPTPGIKWTELNRSADPAPNGCTGGPGSCWIVWAKQASMPPAAQQMLPEFFADESDRTGEFNEMLHGIARVQPSCQYIVEGFERVSAGSA